MNGSVFFSKARYMNGLGTGSHTRTKIIPKLPRERFCPYVILPITQAYKYLGIFKGNCILFFIKKVCCMHSLESPHRCDSKSTLDIPLLHRRSKRHVLTLKAPRKPTSENVVCLCRLLNILANFSKLFFAYLQTVWTQIRLLL